MILGIRLVSTFAYSRALLDKSDKVIGARFGHHLIFLGVTRTLCHRTLDCYFECCLPLFVCAERCSRIIAKPPSKSAVKAWFYNLTNSLQKITNDKGAFPALVPRRILTLVSNCRNLHSASPSFSKDGCTHTVKSVLRLAKRPNNVTPRISAHEIHFSHAKE